MVGSVVLNGHNGDDVACQQNENEDIVDQSDDPHQSFRKNVDGKDEVKQTHENQSDEVNVPQEKYQEVYTEHVTNQSLQYIRKFQYPS